MNTKTTTLLHLLSRRTTWFATVIVTALFIFPQSSFSQGYSGGSPDTRPEIKAVNNNLGVYSVMLNESVLEVNRSLENLKFASDESSKKMFNLTVAMLILSCVTATDIFLKFLGYAARRKKCKASLSEPRSGADGVTDGSVR